MEPVAVPHVPNHRSYLQRAERCCMFTPFLCCGALTCGGTGFAFATAFGGGALTNVAMGQIAFDVYAALFGIGGAGGYWYIMPKRLFEENIEEQRNANNELKTTLGQVDTSIDTFHQNNSDLKKTLDETDVTIKNLKEELQLKTNELLELSEILKSTLNELNAIKEDFTQADATINDAKVIIASMIDMSKKIKKDIKTSKVAVDLFKDYNQVLNKEVKDIDLENKKLSDLLTGYSKIVEKEHTQFSLLIKACDEMNLTCQTLKKELDEFTQDGKDFSDDINRDAKNTSKLEDLQKQLENINNQLK